MNGEVIKSFLVGLGFGVDDASLAKFNKSISNAALKVTALYASINAMAAASVFAISKVSEGFEQMGYEYRIIAPAINKALMLRREMLKAYEAAGINITKVVQESVKLNFSLAKTRFAFEAIYKSVASRFFGVLTKQSDAFRKTIYANMPKIQNFLERFIKFIFKALEAVTTLGVRLWSILTRVYDFFVMLDKATDGWSTRVIAVIAAWKLLNLEFLATPLGMLLTGFVAILALWDDFKTFQEGGESLINWAKLIPLIDSVTSALKSMADIWRSIVDIIGNVVLAFYQLFQGDFSGFFDSLIESGKSVINLFKSIGDTILGLGGVLGQVAGAVGNFFGNSNAAANVQNAPGGVPRAAPVGNQVQNSQTNMNVNQQTQINVSGSADAGAVGKQVSSEQGKVNFDMVRNMKGATR